MNIARGSKFYTVAWCAKVADVVVYCLSAGNYRIWVTYYPNITVALWAWRHSPHIVFGTPDAPKYGRHEWRKIFPSDQLRLKRKS